MKHRHRIHVRTLLLVVAALLAAAWLLPPFFHAGRYRRLVQAGLENKLGRSVTLGAVSFHLLPHPGFSAENVMIEQAPRFGSEPFARVARAECDLHWQSLWSANVDCSRVLLRHPSLNIVRNGQGAWNIEEFLLRSSSLAGARPAHGGSRRAEGFALGIQDGRVSFTEGMTKKPFAVAGLDGWLTLNRAAGTARFHFTGTPERTDLTVPAAPGPIDVSGEWLIGNNFTGPFSIELHAHDSALFGWIPLLTGRNPEVYGVADAAVTLNGSIDHVAVNAHVTVGQLHRSASLPFPSPMPVQLGFAGFFDRPRGELFVQNGEVSFGQSSLHVTGMVRQLPVSPVLDLVFSVQQSRLQDWASLAGRIWGRTPGLSVAGRADGLLAIQGPWGQRSYSGFVSARSLRLQSGEATFNVPEARVRINDGEARLLPAPVLLGHGVECVARATLSPGEMKQASGRPVSEPAHGGYQVTLTAARAPLHNLLRLARSLGLERAANLDARGWAHATVIVSGGVWPLRRPRWMANATLEHASLLIPGVTEPVHLRQFKLQAQPGQIRVDPLAAQIGRVTFTGWLERRGSPGSAWLFDVRAPRLSMENASLWFTVLGHKKPMSLWDLIPGLRTLVERRAAQKNIFASVDARGRFECPQVTFRSLDFQNVSARVSVARRVARLENVRFRAAGGQGKASATIEFNQAPAGVAGQFSITAGRLARLRSLLPPALKGIRGFLSARGRFLTRGLTAQEMSAHLQGGAEVDVRDVSFGAFDPVKAIARAGLIYSFHTDRRNARLSLARFILTAHHHFISLAPVSLLLSGAEVSLNGRWAYDGMTDLYVRANLSRVRSLQNVAETPMDGPKLAATDRTAASTGLDFNSSHAPHSSPSGVTQSNRVTLHLAGSVRGLVLVRGLASPKNGHPGPAATVRPASR